MTSECDWHRSLVTRSWGHQIKNGQSVEWRCAVSSVSCVVVPTTWGMICSKPNITEDSGNGHIHYLLMLSSSLSSGEEIRHALEKLAIFPVGNVYTRRKHVGLSGSKDLVKWSKEYCVSDEEDGSSFIWGGVLSAMSDIGVWILYRHWCIIYTIGKSEDKLYYIAESMDSTPYSVRAEEWRQIHTMKCLWYDYHEVEK